MITAEQIRSIVRSPIDGLILGIIACSIYNWQIKRWSRWIPTGFGEKGKAQLLEEYQTTHRIANVLAMVGLLTGSLYYRKNHWMTGSDWRGIGIAMGLMTFLPVAYIVAVSVSYGSEKVKEALVAYVIRNRMPTKVFIVFVGIFFITGAICAISVLLQTP